MSCRETSLHLSCLGCLEVWVVLLAMMVATRLCLESLQSIILLSGASLSYAIQKCGPTNTTMDTILTQILLVKTLMFTIMVASWESTAEQIPVCWSHCKRADFMCYWCCHCTLLMRLALEILLPWSQVEVYMELLIGQTGRDHQDFLPWLFISFLILELCLLHHSFQVNPGTLQSLQESFTWWPLDCSLVSFPRWATTTKHPLNHTVRFQNPRGQQDKLLPQTILQLTALCGTWSPVDWPFKLSITSSQA